MASALPFIGAGASVLGSLFKGNKTSYTNKMTAQQQYAYNQLLKLLTSKMTQTGAGYQPTSNALSLLYKTYLPGVNYTKKST